MRLGAVTAAGREPRRRRHGGVRRPAAQPPERPHRARRQGGAARPVLRRLRAGAVAPAAHRRTGADGRAARLQDRPPLDGDRRARRARRCAASARKQASRTRPGRTPSPRARSTTRAPGGGTSPPPTTSAGHRRSSARSGSTRRCRRSPSRVPRVGASASASRSTRPAQVTLRIETASGIVLRALPATALQPGARSIRWDGRLPGGSLAFAGSYVAHLLVASDVGTSDRSVSFRYQR